jgi:glycosyltransferase involved in cell wall biosynthesis
MAPYQRALAGDYFVLPVLVRPASRADLKDGRSPPVELPFYGLARKATCQCQLSVAGMCLRSEAASTGVGPAFCFRHRRIHHLKVLTMLSRCVGKRSEGWRMQILTAAEDLDAQGGLERAQLQACRELRARGHRIDLLYTQPGDLGREWDLIVDRKVRVRGYRLSRHSPFATGAAVFDAAGAARRLAPDMVYLHNPYHAPSIALSGRPSVCHLHLPALAEPSKQDMFGLRRVSAFISVSRFTAEQWRAHLGRDIENFAIVPNGVDVDRFRPSNDRDRRLLRASMGLPVDRFLVVYAGRIVPEKGVDCALEAMRLLPPEEYHLAVAGTSNAASFRSSTVAANAYGRELRSRYGDVPASWLGHLNDVSQLVAAADVLVLPSRWPEPFGLTVLEALASGTPVVASAVGGIVELLTGAPAANLVPPEDPRALAERLRSLHGWRTKTPELGPLGRRHAETHYTLDQMGNRLNETIAQIQPWPRGGSVWSRTAAPTAA